MKIKMKWTTTLWALALAVLFPAAALAQSDATPAQSSASQNQIEVVPAKVGAPVIDDIAGSFYATFTTKSTTGNGVTQGSSNSEGGLFEVRQIRSNWIGYEFAFSLNPDNQTVTPVPGNCGYSCNLPPFALSVVIPAFSLDYIASRQYGRLRPFLVGGFGLTTFVSQGLKGTYISTPARPTEVAGAGLDWALTPRLGIRLQYRENILTVPHMNSYYPNTGGYTPIGEPMVGVYLRVPHILPPN